MPAVEKAFARRFERIIQDSSEVTLAPRERDLVVKFAKVCLEWSAAVVEAPGQPAALLLVVRL